jgi:hypothetical protein
MGGFLRKLKISPAEITRQTIAIARTNRKPARTFGF